MTRTEVTVAENSEEFDKTINEMQKNHPNAKILVYLFGAIKQETGQSWCPDCVVSEPLVSDLLKELDGQDVVIVRCPIEREGYKGNAQHPFRLHDKIKLKSVPTLIWWQGDSTSDRVVEEEFVTGDHLLEFSEKLLK